MTPIVKLALLTQEFKTRRFLSFDDTADRQFVAELLKALSAAAPALQQSVKPSSLKMVREWHNTFEVPIADKPDIRNVKLNALRLNLLAEELAELEQAMSDNDMVEVVDALADLQYILDGTWLTLGLGDFKDRAFAEVQRSNMTKLGADGKPLKRADGKVLKGPNFEEPQLLKAIPELEPFIKPQETQP